MPKADTCDLVIKICPPDGGQDIPLHKMTLGKQVMAMGSWWWWAVVAVAQSCPTLCDPMHCSPQGSSVHGTLQARILEWVAIPFTRGSSPTRDRTLVSCIAGRLPSELQGMGWQKTKTKFTPCKTNSTTPFISHVLWCSVMPLTGPFPNPQGSGRGVWTYRHSSSTLPPALPILISWRQSAWERAGKNRPSLRCAPGRKFLVGWRPGWRT